MNVSKQKISQLLATVPLGGFASFVTMKDGTPVFGGASQDHDVLERVSDAGLASLNGTERASQQG
jgi:hypothetical protein